MDIQTLLPLLQKFLPMLNGMQSQEPPLSQNQIAATQSQNAYSQNISETASLYPNSYIDSPAAAPPQSQPSFQNTNYPTSANSTFNQGAQTGNMLSQITSLLSSSGGANGLMNLLSKSNGGDMLSVLSSLTSGKKNNSQICELKCVNDYTFD